MTKRSWIYFFVIAINLSFLSSLQATEEINIVGSSKYTIAIESLENETATKTLTEDLKASEYFVIKSPVEASFVASGSAGNGFFRGYLTNRKGKILIDKRYSGSSLKRSIHEFADDIVEEITGKQGMASSQIVFVGKQGQEKDLYICDYDGTNIHRVTKDQTLSVAPSVSKKGDKIAYTGYRSGYADIYLIDMRNTSRRRIISAPGTNSGAIISPNGKKIALTMSFSGNPELYVTNLSGKKPKRLTRSMGIESSPSWSPDGKKIVYTSNQGGSPQLYIISATGGRPKKVETGFDYCTEPSWSPDGSRLAFNILYEGSIRVAIYDFKKRESRIISSGGNAEDPCWSPNSKHLLYVQGGNLYRVNVHTKERKTILSGLNASEPSWTN